MQFDRERFKELVLYIAWKTKDIDDFGRVKIAKTLFYSDLCAFGETGSALTGARYEHFKNGPCPPAIFPIWDELIADGLARQEMRGMTKKLVPLAQPDTPESAYLADAYIGKLVDVPTWGVSDRSHDHPGWLLTGDREEIPYHVALMSRRRPTGADFARVQELAREHGWD